MKSVSFVCLSKESWANPRRARKQLLFKALLKQSTVEEVLYVDPGGHFGRSRVKSAPNLTGMRICQRGYFLRGERFAFVRAINRLEVYLSLRNVLRQRAQWYTVFYNPWDIILAQRLSRHGPVIFDWTEDWAIYHGNSYLGGQQKAAIRIASGVVAVTESLADRARNLCGNSKKTLFLPNATAWKPSESLECPEDMVHIPFPRIGYIGHLGPWFDKDLVMEVSRVRPDWQWVMVGYSDRNVRDFFRNCDNVHLVGQRSFNSLQAYMAQCQVLVAPYRKNVEGDSSKLYDYLTLGHPIVSTEMLTARRLQPHIRIASDRESWLQALAQALAENDPSASQARQAVSLQHTWDLRASSFIKWVEELKSA
jgi:glycosyltransferase involved in cell wall biosynthesis